MREVVDEMCCGTCCWFKNEDIFGFGYCYAQPLRFCKGCMRCYDRACKHYVSRGKMRHYMAVLLQHKRFVYDIGVVRYPVGKNELVEAMAFAYKYMKFFEKL